MGNVYLGFDDMDFSKFAAYCGCNPGTSIGKWSGGRGKVIMHPWLDSEHFLPALQSISFKKLVCSKCNYSYYDRDKNGCKKCGPKAQRKDYWYTVSKGTIKLFKKLNIDSKKFIKLDLREKERLTEIGIKDTDSQNILVDLAISLKNMYDKTRDDTYKAKGDTYNMFTTKITNNTKTIISPSKKIFLFKGQNESENEYETQKRKIEIRDGEDDEDDHLHID